MIELVIYVRGIGDGKLPGRLGLSNIRLKKFISLINVLQLEIFLDMTVRFFQFRIILQLFALEISDNI